MSGSLGSLAGSFLGGSVDDGQLDYRYRTLTKLGDEELLATAQRARLEVTAGGMDGPPVASSRPTSGRHQAVRGMGNKRVRSNTTNSIYLTSTMSTADTETTIKVRVRGVGVCVCVEGGVGWDRGGRQVCV
jgi:hypothetical protein